MRVQPPADVAKALRLTRDLPRYFARPIGERQAIEALRQRLATRETRLLGIAERAIYGHPTSPYRWLLEAAGCELGDFRTLVATEGVEGALARLDAAGVYLTLEEFKGRRAVVRGSRRLTVTEDDFDNPLIRPHLEAQTGGTRGRGTSVKMAMAYFADLAVNTGVAFRAHGLWSHEHVVWLQGFPPLLIYAMLGRRILAWLLPTGPLPERAQLYYMYARFLAGLSGRRLPRPRMAVLERPDRLAHWLGDRRREGRLACVTSYASSAVRICLAAQQAGLRLDGTCFITLGEPFTDAKRRVVEAVGAHPLVRYAFTEAGIIGYGCATPRESDDLHFLDDSYGLIRRARTLPDSDRRVDALRFTTLLSTAPKILMNVESGDTARLARRSCGCALGAAGLRQHLAGIQSFEKLSGEGMAFIHTDLVRVLEEVLPARFGGTSADYQALEEEGDQGILRLLLVVSPRVGPIDEAALVQTFLRELGQDGGSSAEGARVWGQAGTVEVRRREPQATGAGKILPFHLVQALSVPRSGSADRRPENPSSRGAAP